MPASEQEPDWSDAATMCESCGEAPQKLRVLIKIGGGAGWWVCLACMQRVKTCLSVGLEARASSSLDDAIQQLRWLITEDFAERRGTVYLVHPEPVTITYWWEHEIRRQDIRRLRSYIAGVRVLEAAR